jgi:hypothetical protein
MPSEVAPSRIAVVTTFDACDIRKWSGITSFMMDATDRQSIALESMGRADDPTTLLPCRSSSLRRRPLHRGGSARGNLLC